MWVRFHDIRHTAVSRMVDGGIPLPTIGALLGWSAGTLANMMKRYAHANDPAFKRAVGLLEGPEQAISPKPEEPGNVSQVSGEEAEKPKPIVN